MVTAATSASAAGSAGLPQPRRLAAALRRNTKAAALNRRILSSPPSASRTTLLGLVEVLLFGLERRLEQLRDLDRQPSRSSGGIAEAAGRSADRAACAHELGDRRA